MTLLPISTCRPVDLLIDAMGGASSHCLLIVLKYHTVFREQKTTFTERIEMYKRNKIIRKYIKNNQRNDFQNTFRI